MTSPIRTSGTPDLAFQAVVVGRRPAAEELKRICRITATLTGHSDDVNGVAYTPDGTTVVSAGGD
ncbi:hypothetical protein ACWD3L_18465, partial [Streptomyces sp. NPDC002587]